MMAASETLAENSFVSKAECQEALIVNLLPTGGGPATDDEFMRLCNWAHEVMVNNTLLELALAGQVGLDVRSAGEIQVSANAAEWLEKI